MSNILELHKLSCDDFWSWLCVIIALPPPFHDKISPNVYFLALFSLGNHMNFNFFLDVTRNLMMLPRGVFHEFHDDYILVTLGPYKFLNYLLNLTIIAFAHYINPYFSKGKKVWLMWRRNLSRWKTSLKHLMRMV